MRSGTELNQFLGIFLPTFITFAPSWTFRFSVMIKAGASHSKV